VSTIKSSAENLTLNADGANNDVIIQSNGSTKVTVDGQNSRVGIGTATPTRTLTVSSTGQTDLAIIAGTSASAQLQFGDSGDDNIGQIEYNNADNTMAFYTNATEAMEIGSSGDITAKTGDIVFGTAGKGIVLGSTTNVDANTLDDYEEGTWTPTIIAKSSNPSVTYGHQHGYYTKVGNLVTAVFRVYVGAGGISGGSGDGQVGGLPYTTKSHSGGQGGLGSVNMNYLRYEGTYSAGRNSVDIMLQENSSTMDIRQFKPETPASLHTGLSITQIDDGLFNFEGSVIYLT
jgi:hypothetical protein